MLAIIFICVYCSVFGVVLAFSFKMLDERPKLTEMLNVKEKLKGGSFRDFLRNIASINKFLCKGGLRDRISKDIIISQSNLTPDEFFLIKEVCILGLLFLSYPFITEDFVFFWFMMSFAFGYILPDMWISGKIRKVKAELTKDLPDAIDLLSLCVNAGLDFMLSLKWVVSKSSPSVIISEFNVILQEINVGKTRREAIKDLAKRYDLPDLSTFARTLIQADKMGTSVTEALNILSEDMRLARFRRGEQIAMKAPMKMLVPLLMCIFPVVCILVAGPIFIDFMENNPFAK